MVVKELKDELKKIDARGIAVLLGISLILGLVYSAFIHNLALALLATTIAVFGSYFLLSSFEREEKPLALMPGEKTILKTLDMGYIMFPGKKGAFLTNKSERDLSIYLTNKRIVARKASGEIVLDLMLQSISGVVVERKVMTNHLRITYLFEGKDRQMLLFIGNTDLWMQRLSDAGVKERDEYDSIESPKKEAGFVEDADTLRQKIEKRQ